MCPLSIIIIKCACHAMAKHLLGSAILNNNNVPTYCPYLDMLICLCMEFSVPVRHCPFYVHIWRSLKSLQKNPHMGMLID